MYNFISFLLESKKNEVIQDFISFAKNYLHLQDDPIVHLVNERDGTISTANFNIQNKHIKVYSKNRAVCDICRSIAHELVHQQQLESINDPSKLDGSTGSPHEDEANALAGRIIREYGKLHPDFYNN